MCSILGILELQTDPGELRRLALDLSRRQRHRGPDWSGIFANDQAILAHERLAIVDVDNGAQPLQSADGRLVLAVNGEIYNHRELRDQLQACISALGERQRDAFVLRELDGLSHRDVATVLGTSDMNVRKLVQRARASLRACLVDAGVRDA